MPVERASWETPVRDGVDLVLGPMPRYADATAVTLWLEATGSCEVEVRAGPMTCRDHTFEVEGHHYALVVIEGLAPGTDLPYTVALDGRVVWPAAGAQRPPSRLRTTPPSGDLHVVLGSCRVDRPHREPWDLEPERDVRGVGVDALRALSVSCARGERPLPDLLLMLGDQVYADEGLAPRVREWQVERRGPESEPRHGVADFEEYTWLYRDSWSDADVRWLLSTVPTAMVFDDHDVHDDWNTSEAWRHQIQRLPWWSERITGAYMSYWVYQHLGNVSPAELAEDGLLPALQAPGARGGPLRDRARRADDEVDGRKLSWWSYVRDLGTTRLVVVDTRSGRVLEQGRRSMLSEPEWQGVEGQLRGDCTHLLVASSLPVFMERAVHDLESWSEAVCGGAWGRRAAQWGERIRQALDLEHWAAFRSSFDRLAHRLAEVGAGRRGTAPASVLVLSGDVHHSYVASIRYPSAREVRSAVVQVVSSPLRNAFPRRLQRAFRFSSTPFARLIGRGLARSVRLPSPEAEWQVTTGPVYGNTLTSLLLDGGQADLRFERAVLERGRAALREVHRERLDQHRRPEAHRSSV
ncbi:PhoD-like phosphatase [Blastococcus colisei]|uniref:PhoD-like phosphatase n=1 Tax=Blastococcus colisei TaxID=1564162 RepID=A0A543P0N4_9ACTN|nr:PhoD-like phosphatase [Blastococcus colisei]